MLICKTVIQQIILPNLQMCILTRQSQSVILYNYLLSKAKAELQLKHEWYIMEPKFVIVC